MAKKDPKRPFLGVLTDTHKKGPRGSPKKGSFFDILCPVLDIFKNHFLIYLLKIGVLKKGRFFAYFRSLFIKENIKKLIKKAKKPKKPKKTQPVRAFFSTPQKGHFWA